MAIGRRQQLDVAALIFFLATTTTLFARFHSSAAFERPIHFSILTLLLTGAASSVAAKRASAELPSAIRLAPALEPSRLRTVPNGASLAFVKAALELLRRLRPPSAPLTLLVFCLVGRVLLFWRTIRTIQCSVDGLYTLLPLVLVGIGAAGLQLSGHGRKAVTIARHHDVRSGPRFSAARYAAFAIAWGFSAIMILRAPGQLTGAICPPGWRWEPFIPLAQITMLLLDAIVVFCIYGLWERQDAPGTTPAIISSALLSSAGVLVLLAALSFYNSTNISWSLRIHYVGVRDVVFDSILASGAALAGIYLLISLHAATLAVIFGAVGITVQQCSRIFGSAADLDCSGSWTLGIVAIVCVGALLHFDKDMASSAGSLAGETAHVHRTLMRGYLASVIFLFIIYFGVASPLHTTTDGRHAIAELTDSASRSSDAWIDNAQQSRTFDEAVAEYRKRYEIPPPPNFDKWYQFAVSVNSTIIDNFDQIHSDLRPFWGLEPVVLRERLAHLLEYPWLDMGGMRIRDKTIELSPHTPGTHAWMMESNTLMIQPFLQWLPDMDLAFNLNDECRMAIPFEEMRSFHSAADKVRARLAKVLPVDLRGFVRSGNNSSPFSSRFVEPDGAHDPGVKSPYFVDNTRRQIYYDVVAPTCPPDSPARRGVWWDRKAICSACTAGHTLAIPRGRAISNWTAAGDLCHQPDLAYLHGFLRAPAPMTSTKMLFPIFSQARVGGFSDVLVPSPWNFFDKTTYDASRDMVWRDKKDTVFWRGSPSDGFAIHGAWEGFLRARFVHAAQRFMAGKGTPGWMEDDHRQHGHHHGHLPRFDVNVSFVGPFRKCDESDCEAETDTFYRYGSAGGGASGAAAPTTPDTVPFDDHWSHRHLVDLDGAGFSGRFLPFLQSRSLVYRAALFRTWFEERVHAWRHYIPLDVRLGGGLWGVVDFFADSRSGGGAELGRRIAEEGREWAARALRKEDMQVYMFRLLLEWGRLLDDGREVMGMAGE